jgi:hypothetical protein
MNRLVLTLSSICCVVGAATTQNNTVFPSDHTGTSPLITLPGATSESYVPFSYGVRRQMLFLDAWDLHIPNGRAISRIGFVRDGTSTSTGYALQMKVVAGQSTRSLDNVSTTFADNISTTPTVVFGSATGGAKIFNLPDLGGVAGVEMVWLPFDTPFPFDAQKNLVLDFQVFANQNGNATFAYRLDAAQHRSPVRSFNQACPTSGNRFPAVVSNGSSTYVGGNWYLSLSNGPATAPMALLVGVQSYEPGIALDVLGATGCQLSVDGLWSGAYATSASGAYSWTFPIPMNLDLFGGRLYSQAILQDVFANPLGWVTSTGDEITLGIRPRAARIHGAQGDAQATTGSIERNFGLILIFDHN